jgi:hypothetical protein
MRQTVEERNLMNTLKRVVGQYMPVELDNFEQNIQDFFDDTYSDLKKVESSGTSGLFFFINGKRNVFNYIKQNQKLIFPEETFTRIMKQFGIDDDQLEYLLRDWFEKKTNLEVKDFYLKPDYVN